MNMDKLFFRYLIIAVLASVVYVHGQTAINNIEKRLGSIEQKLSKVDALLDGFTKLCQTLCMIKTLDTKGDVNPPSLRDCPEQSEKSGYENDRNNEESDIEDEEAVSNHTVDFANATEDTIDVGQLDIVAVQSKLIDDMSTNVTVSFVAGDNYFAQWFADWGVHGYDRSQSFLTKDKINEEKNRYTSTFTIIDRRLILRLFVVITSPAYSAELAFNTSGFNLTWSQDINRVEYKILEYRPSIVVPGDELEREDFLLTIKVTENVVTNMTKGHYCPGMSLSFVNNSIDPVKYTDKVHQCCQNSTHSEMSMSVKNGSTDELVIKVNKDVAVFGGTLIIRLPQDASGYICKFYYGMQVKIINEDIGDIMPHGTVAVYRSPEVQYVLPYMSIYCFAAGIPLPRLTILKKRSNKLYKISADYELVFDNRSAIKIIGFNPAKLNKAAGEYICRASNDNETVEHKMIYLPFKRVTFDKIKSVVRVNTTKKTVVTCKAVGNPTPKLEMRANFNYGRNLLEYESTQYKHKFNTRKHVNKLTMVISPVDASISSIFCLASQLLEHTGENIVEHYEIKIRPPERYDFGHELLATSTLSPNPTGYTTK